MRIGLNLKSLSQNNSFKMVTSESDYKKMIKKVELSEGLKSIIDSIEKDNHEIFIFTPTPVELSEKIKLQIKRSLIKRFNKMGIDISKITIIGEDDLVPAMRRNHIDIAVASDKENISQLLEFTDVVEFGEGKSYDDLLKEIYENVDKNRQLVMAYDSEPKGLPSEDKLWLKYYRIGDLKWKDERMSPYDRLVSSNIDWKDEIAMEFFGRKYTYQEFFEEVDKLADKMLANGIKKGMRVPIVFVNAPESIIALYALYKVKATIVPIFPLSTKEDFQNKIESINKQNVEDGFENTYMFMSDFVCGRFKEVVPKDTKTIVLPITKSMPKPLALAFKKVLMPKLGVKPVEFNEQFISYDNFDGDITSIGEIDTSYDDNYTAVQLYTGGTIRPKGVMLSEGSIDASARQFYNDRFDFKRGDKIAAFMPLNHSFGLIIGTHVAATLGVNLDLIMKINFERLDKLFLKDKVNLFGGIPNMFPAIRNNKHMENADLSHVKYVLSGGSSLDPTERQETDRFFEEHNSNARVRDGYGQTESAGGIIYDGIPNIGTDIKIVEPNTTSELGYEQLGELCLSGPQIMMGYDEEALNDAVLKEHSDGKVWLHTGDSAIIHRDGKVEIIGRLDRMIKVNGEQVILDKLEEEINTLPFIEKSVVVKRPDDIRGYVPVAYIKLKPGFEWNENLENQLNEFYRKKLTSFTRPRKTDVLDEFPVTNVGKIDFKALEKLAIEQQGIVKTK